MHGRDAAQSLAAGNQARRTWDGIDEHDEAERSSERHGRPHLSSTRAKRPSQYGPAIIRRAPAHKRGLSRLTAMLSQTGLRIPHLSYHFLLYPCVQYRTGMILR